jgi:hypothetical protein
MNSSAVAKCRSGVCIFPATLSGPGAAGGAGAYSKKKGSTLSRDRWARHRRFKPLAFGSGGRSYRQRFHALALAKGSSRGGSAAG